MAQVSDLFSTLNRDVVIATLEELYPDQVKNREGHERAWDEISSLEAKPREDGMVVVLAHVPADPEDGEDAESYIDVSGAIAGDDTSWSLQFEPWASWLAMGVTFKGTDMTEEQAAAHILYEMTWAGYSQEEVQERRDEINSAMAEVEDIISALPTDATPADLAAAGLITLGELIDADHEDDDDATD